MLACENCPLFLCPMSPTDESLLWPNWPEFVKGKQDCRFNAQGTLINKHSIGKTIKRANLLGPVIALGVRRIFNFALEDQNYEDHGGRYRRSEDQNRRATLNVVHTGNAEDKVNGILFSTAPGDIDALAEREYGYDLLPVAYRVEVESGAAYLFIARKTSPTIGRRVLEDIYPNESSLNICLTGAATYGQAFLTTWIESCYLADGTPLMKHPFYKDLVQKIIKEIDLQVERTLSS